MWLVISVDRRVSVWLVDWTKDFCEFVDWLIFFVFVFLFDGLVVLNKDKVKKNDKIDLICDRIFKICILCFKFVLCRNFVRSCFYFWLNF